MENKRLRELSGLNEAVAGRKVIQALQKLVKDAKPVAKMIKNTSLDNESEGQDIRDLIEDLENVVDDIGSRYPNK